MSHSPPAGWPVDPAGGTVPGETLQYVADRRTGPHLAADVLRVQFGQVRVWASYAVVVAAFVIFGITQRQTVIGLVVGPLFVLIMLGTLYLRSRRGMTRAYPQGSVHTSSFRHDSMVLSGPIGTSDVRYSAFKRLWVQRHSVTLRRRDAAILIVIPIELMPPAAITMIGQAISRP